jgi:hypothetical protein
MFVLLRICFHRLLKSTRRQIPKIYPDQELFDIIYFKFIDSGFDIILSFNDKTCLPIFSFKKSILIVKDLPTLRFVVSSGSRLGKYPLSLKDANFFLR